MPSAPPTLPPTARPGVLALRGSQIREVANAGMGRADVLPTGRNLTTTDPRAIPTRTAAAIGARAADEVVRRLGDVVFSRDDETLEATVGRLLTRAGATLACAESLTGGSVGARLTSVAGSSSSGVRPPHFG